jgi:hypothetical protein
MNTPEDMLRFPQNLNPYAELVGRDKRLLGADEQAARDAVFNRIFFAPWDMSKASVRKKDVVAVFGKARGYKADGRPWRQEEWDMLARKAGLAAFPSRQAYAVTLRNTDLREMPTHEPRFAKPTPDAISDPFDYFQYSLLPPGTPLFIAHTTPDGRWHYVECPVAGGWVDTQDIAPINAEFRRAYRTGRYAAIVRDNVSLAENSAGTGAVFPVKEGSSSGGILRVLFPVRNGPQAALGEAALGPEDAVLKPMPLTPGNIARIGNAMMGRHYGWGGMFGNRDCSALTRDIFTPFGLWLPRNSAAQARVGSACPLDGMSPGDKEALILDRGVPFASLVAARGHIMLYIGKYRGRAAVFHSVWGIRVIEGDDDNARFVIGRAGVTSITPGRELQNLYSGATLADRLHTLTILTDRR